jgi:hypothetical protein
MITLFLLAIVGMTMTFFTFSSTVWYVHDMLYDCLLLLSLISCSQIGFNSGAYPCKVGNGTYYTVVAIGLYVFTVFFFCLTPKPKPLILRMEGNKDTDPCLCCSRKKKEEKEEKDVEKAAQAPPAQAPPVVGEEPDAAAIAVAAGAGAAAVTNQMDKDERPPSHVVYAYDDLSDQSSVGAMTVPFYRSADVVEGDLYFDANTVA